MVLTTPFWTLKPSWYLVSGRLILTSTTGGQDFVIGIHAFACQDLVQLLYLIYTWFPIVQTWRTGHCCQLHHRLVLRVLKYKLLSNLRLRTNLNYFFVLCWIVISQIIRIGQNFHLWKFHLVFKGEETLISKMAIFYLSKFFLFSWWG